MKRQMTEAEGKRKELVKELLQVSNVKSGEDINDIIKEMIGELLIGGYVNGYSNCVGCRRGCGSIFVSV